VYQLNRRRLLGSSALALLLSSGAARGLIIKGGMPWLVTDMKAPPNCTFAQPALDARLEQADQKTNRYQQQVKRETDLEAAPR
jgi:hypothetical protein